MKILRTTAVKALCAAVLLVPMMSGCSRIDERVESDTGVSSSDSLSSDMAADDSRYIYSSLSDKEKEYYNCIRDAAFGFEENVVFPDVLEPELIKKMFIAVYYQEEELFWLSNIFYRPSEPTDKLMLGFRYDEETVRRMQSEIKTVTDDIFDGFDENTSDYEKLRSFHDRIVLGCTFTKESDHGNTIYGALCDGYAQCEGYAFAFDYLCSLADIDCFTVSGTNMDGDSHSWNIVKLDGKWYNVDCTWDDPILEQENKDFIRYYYFLVSDSDISGVTHIPDATYFSLPICSDGENFYVREGLMASSADEGVKLLSEACALAIRTGRTDAAVRFTDKSAYEKAKMKLFDMGEIKNVFAYANEHSDKKVLDSRYVRYANDDQFIIHISMIFA
ncbi:MAG: transglutaminase domain-containing protein [Huintestinicola sp.]